MIRARTWCALSVLAASLLAGSQGVQADYQDELVQPDTLAAPGHASVIGSLAKQTFGPESLAQGMFSLPLPLAFPDERGALLWSVAPSYQPGGGMGVWGQGWRSDLTISRTRYGGHLDGVNDAFMSPWGRLTAGNDGHQYVLGFAEPIRFSYDTAEQQWAAVTGGGTYYTFEPFVVAGVSSVFEWYLTEVRSVTGYVTRLRYSSGTGQRYLESITYGGQLADVPPYEISLVYEELVRPIRDYALGYERVLAKRVASVIVRARRADPDAPPDVREELWSYALGYQASSFGPSFYLTSVARSLPGNEGRVSEPAISYGYNDGAVHLATATAEPVQSPELTVFFAQANHGGSWIQPRWSSTFDENRDGVGDFENAETYKALRFTGVQWEVYDVPGAPNADRRCRPDPASNIPSRTLIKVLGPDRETFAVKSKFRTVDTEFVVCQRNGEVVRELILAGRWDLGPRNRLTDINRDHLPDLVRLWDNRVEVRLNQSSQGVVAFGEPIVQSLTPNLPTSTGWIHDMNGDGWGDVVGKLPSGLQVWYGRATGGFVTVAPRLQFFRDGAVIPIGTSDLAFKDANGDGLADVVVTLGSRMYLYMNEGDRFSFAHRLDDRLSGGHEGMPVAQNLTESGEEEILFSMRDTVRVMELSQPSTGLLTRADDGRGNEIVFEYERAAAQPGLPARPRVIARTTHMSNGLDDLVHDYDYADPVVHPAGRFLVGFGSIKREGPDGTREQELYHDAELHNLPTFERHAWAAETDSQGGISVFEQVVEHTYQEASHLGVRLRRPDQIRSGLRTVGGDLQDVRTTRFLQYARGVCATRSKVQSQHGSLTRIVELATVAELTTDLHCLSRKETLVGAHPANPSFDFLEKHEIDRNDLGQPILFTALASGERLVLQDIGYDTRHRIESITVPGHGTTELAYDPFDRLTRVISPEGIVTEAQRHSTADLIEALKVARGQVEYLQSFRYDDFMRLSKSWDSFRGGSESDPLEEVAYQFASASGLGATRASQVADVETGARVESVAWIAADGTALASGTLAPDEAGRMAWVVNDLVQPQRELLTTTSYVAPRFAGDWQVTTSDQLWSGAVETGASVSTGAGTPRLTAVLLQGERDLGGRFIPPIISTTDTWYVVTSTGMAQYGRVAANDDLVAMGKSDLDGKLIERIDQDGHTTRLLYDTAGRLRRVVLADGTAQTASFDSFGRLSAIAREGLGHMAFDYETVPAHTDRVVTTRYVGEGDTVSTRSVEYTYDAVGRIRRARHRRTADDATVDYDYGYDGAGTTATGQLGRLTEVLGANYRRQTVFNPDGTIQEVTVTLGNWRQLTSNWTYNALGAITSHTRAVVDVASGALVHSSSLENEYDPYGRLSRVSWNGQGLAELTYDEFNRVSTASLEPSTSGPSKSLVLLYDEETRAPAGTWIDQGDWNAGIDWVFDERGLIDFELLTLNDTESLRDYGYDARGFLAETIDPDNVTAYYEYDDTGLISHIVDQAGERALGSGRERVIGGVQYRYDGLGRLSQKGDLALTYGPHGQLARAERADQVWNFVYDERDNRVLKLVGDSPVAAYVDGLYIEPDHVIEPIRIAGVLAGVLVDGTFEPLASDPRGSIWVEPSGSKNVPSAYGVRTEHPQLAPALDYVEKGYDSDLGFVRMGVRDYDPFVGQFATPDPLFLESIGACGESPVDCNLFAYARNNPISLTDPSGLSAPWDDSIAVDYARSQAGVDPRIVRRAEIEASRESAPFALGVIGGTLAGGMVGGFLAEFLGGGFVAAMFSGAAGGVSGGVAATATEDAVRGTLSSPGTYARNAVAGAALGAGAVGVGGVLRWGRRWFGPEMAGAAREVGSGAARAGYNGVQGPAQVTTRATRAGETGARVRYPDGSVKDVTPSRVKEFVPNTHPNAPPGTLQRVPFENPQPGTKGFKRDPTPEDLEWLP